MVTTQQRASPSPSPSQREGEGDGPADTMAPREPSAAAEQMPPLDRESAAFSDSEASEYGLRDLAKLPLLEQVHRLFHAIQQRYPYTETNAWKSLPLDQKKRMLEYIRERRQRQAAAAAAAQSTPLPSAAAVASAPPAIADSSVDATRVRTDPYLQMLQKRTLRSVPVSTTGACAAHPNSVYAAGQAALEAHGQEYVEAASKRQFKARWKLVDSEFYDNPVCVCGQQHGDLGSSTQGNKGASSAALLSTVSAMMSTFGDATRPCATTVQHVHAVVGKYLRQELAPLVQDDRVGVPCLRTLVEIFAEEAVYYGRWREFRSETKQQDTDLEDVEEEQLAEELDLFAVSEADAVFNDAFLERIRFADERTRGMDWSIYDSFARSRKLNFMSQRSSAFRQWLGFGPLSKASLEFMNFVAYHNIGRLVEAAIKKRTGGALRLLESPLMKSDIEAVGSAAIDET
ncbi:hypothetical protein P43SY_008312 [Pythium insidiosum]|uniref:Uncharacterized protein n=1 Tax=Pythium insidiosum TaxID=114742 RepID=A0AAD5Q7U9_PYTIN|nr:hypothetical protein P43SY_008312 [Pythium insidiosum]